MLRNAGGGRTGSCQPGPAVPLFAAPGRGVAAEAGRPLHPRRRGTGGTSRAPRGGVLGTASALGRGAAGPGMVAWHRGAAAPVATLTTGPGEGVQPHFFFALYFLVSAPFLSRMPAATRDLQTCCAVFARTFAATIPYFPSCLGFLACSFPI